MAIVALLAMTAVPAWAAVSLPYDYTVTYISGGSSGVYTPHFFSSSTGKICVDSDLSTSTNGDYHGGPITDNYKTTIYKIDWGPDTPLYTLNWEGQTDGYKRCVVNLPANTEMKLRIHKTNFEQGVIMSGDGTVSRS